MPSAPNLTPEQAVDLVHFLRSMSDEATREAMVTKRRHLTAKRVEQIPDATDSQEWDSVESVRLGLMPLWWRDDRVEAIVVRVIHDGSRMAVHLTWPDDTENGHAAQSESFEDAVAIELYSGDTEPFIGMGDPKSPVDVWFWDADRQGEPLAVEDLYTSTVVDRFPFSEAVVATAELDRDGARTSDQPEISLPARASGNPIVPSDDESGGSSLTVGGPGSVTFRIPQSQHAKATGQWKDGRWTVVMTRSLAVESEDDGVRLVPGEHVSVAVAVWDGSHSDRDGKKLVTIWQDLELQD
jgi:DMSO reductase family type II enzyme heme b subunit